jgi:hypothetical protein
MPGITETPILALPDAKRAHPKSLRVLNFPVVECPVNLGFL